MTVDIDAANEGCALVTFALFAYNQEKYIREAIEGAFSQTYTPLEIILSDDCSNDRTFGIMQEMAAVYKGPHRVIARQNDSNAGIINHVLNVANEANGLLMVVAAGDDISHPNRCEILAEAWRDAKPAAVYSGCTDINDDGEILCRDFFPDPLPRIQKLFEGCSTPKRYGGYIRNIPGYSAAYDLSFLKKLPKTKGGIHNEDALTTYIANLCGYEIVCIRDSLLNRRFSVSSISAVSSFESLNQVRRNEHVIQKFSQSTDGFLDYFSELRYLCPSEDYDILLNRLNYDREYYRTVAEFWNTSLFYRLIMLFQACDKKTIRYILPRIFGMNIFCASKFIVQKVRKII